VNVTAPMGASPADLGRLGAADFNVVLYPEIAETAADWLERTFKQPRTHIVPIGHGATCDFIREVAALAGVDPEPVLASDPSRMGWWSRSIDSTYLTSKRVFIFGDATHAIAAARVARDELGFKVVGLGCYNREFARDLRAAAKLYDVEPLITDDYLEVEEAIQARSSPNWCWARRWSGTSPSGCASPAPSFRPPSMSRISRRVTAPKWASKARIYCSTAGSIR
jgi:light-independent protochlorophyllide reductase subunit B